MLSLKNVVQGYKRVEKHVFYAVAAQFCIQAVNTSFFLLLNYYMVEEGFADYEVAEVLSYRFLAVFWLAFPIGLFIKGRRLKPFFWIASISLPILSHLLIWAIETKWYSLLYLCAMLWGISYVCMQITILPFILLNAKKEHHSEAISMSFLAFSSTMFIVGIGNSILNFIDPEIFTEKRVLQLIASVAFLGVLFISKVKVKEQLSNKVPLRNVLVDYVYLGD